MVMGLILGKYAKDFDVIYRKIIRRIWEEFGKDLVFTDFILHPFMVLRHMPLEVWD